jgi:hypothetical protein
LVHLIFLPPKFIYWNIQKFLKYHSDVSEHSGFSELTQKSIQKNIQKNTLEPQSSHTLPVRKWPDCSWMRSMYVM